MPPTAYVLSESDVRVLRDLLRRDERQILSPRNRPSALELEEELFPEVYVILTPSDGIDAYSGGDVPSAVCQVWRLIRSGSNDLLERVDGLTREVYNLSGMAVAGSARGLAARDKFGQWYVIGAPCVFRAPPVTGTGTGTGTSLPASLYATVVPSCASGCWTGDGVDAPEVLGPSFPTYQTASFPPSGCSSGLGLIQMTAYQVDNSDDWYLLITLNGSDIGGAGPVTASPLNPYTITFSGVTLLNHILCTGGSGLTVTFQELP